MSGESEQYIHICFKYAFIKKKTTTDFYGVCMCVCLTFATIHTSAFAQLTFLINKKKSMNENI